MLTRLPLRSMLKCAVLTILVLGFTIQNSSFSQCGYAPLKQIRTKFPSVVGNHWGGTLESLPAGYDPNGTTTYATIIYFHGNGAVGDGSAGNLCSLFSDQDSSLPGMLEKGLWPATISPGGNGTPVKYIVLSPQYNSYWFEGGNFPHPGSVDSLLDYLVQHYKINTNRIYLTGMSAGANIVMEYVGSSINRARRVAAVSVSSLCAPLSNYPNGGQVIAQAHLPVWMIHCASDDPCGIDRPQGWFNAINANESPANPNNPIFTQLNSTSSDPNLRCRNYTHNTWSTLYNSAFRVNGANFMEWSLASVNAALPVKLKSFEASLVNGKVFVKWSTLTETGNAAFTIEKSADGRQFSTLKTIDGVGNSNTERKYEFIDDKPLTNLSYYRLLQTDVDGHQEYSSIKKILNQKGIGKKLIVSPNPFINELSAFVVLDKKQRLVVTLSDMNGHRISQVVQMLSEGSSEISLPVKSLNKGIYLLKVEGETISETMKVVKQ